MLTLGKEMSNQNGNLSRENVHYGIRSKAARRACERMTNNSKWLPPLSCVNSRVAV